jgi:hypothetical protein
MLQETNKSNTWIFIMAGQSNMAGRGLVEPDDTIPQARMLTINQDGKLVIAKEPLHFYEPSLAGLDCGYSFGKTLIKHIPDSISVLLIPTAVGGSSISQWLGDSTHRDVKLMTNFLQKVQIAKQYGTIKGILWHQGESDANEKGIPLYIARLSALFERFRSAIGNKQLPVLLGELGSFSTHKESWKLLNEAINKYSISDSNSTVVSTSDLADKGDNVHFNSAGQRAMGRRFAKAYLKKFDRGY